MFGKFCNPLLSILNLDGGSSLLGTILFPADLGGPIPFPAHSDIQAC